MSHRHGAQRTERLSKWIVWFIDVEKVAPTYEEIRAAFPMSLGTLHAQLRKLEAAGRIRIIPNVARGIRKVEP